MKTTDDAIPVLGWQGEALDCSACAHTDLYAEAGCEPGRACVEDRYAKRIDRFFAR
ncbi:MAG: LRV FeS4 cluster domain-containing protein, partial [Proteobacteria bacterium]|nr:LRV FeS4 cluster domain-containing protein [Pseudomonadota bacterium]